MRTQIIRYCYVQIPPPNPLNRLRGTPNISQSQTIFAESRGPINFTTFARLAHRSNRNRHRAEPRIVDPTSMLARRIASKRSIKAAIFINEWTASRLCA